MFRLDSFNFCLKFVLSFIKKFTINILNSNKYFDIYIRKFNPVCTYCATSRYSRMGVAHRHFSSKEKNLGRNSRSSTSSHVILHTKLYIPSTLNIDLYTVAHTIDCVCSKMLNHGLNHGFFLSLFKLIPCPIHWIVYVLAYLNFIFEF